MARPLWLTLCSEKTPEGQGPQAARHNGIRRVAAGPWAVSDQHTPRMFGSTDPHSCRKSRKSGQRLETDVGIQGQNGLWITGDDAPPPPTGHVHRMGDTAGRPAAFGGE